MDELKKERKDGRTEAEMEVLLGLIDGDQFLRSLAAEVKRRLCEIAVLEVFEANETVFSQGDVGDKFYIVLNGLLEVNVLNNGLSFTAGELVPGQSFGELALINGEKRSATVRTRSRVELMAISRGDYTKTLLALQQKSLRSKLDFLQCVPFFETWTSQQLGMLLESSRIIQVPGKHVVCRQGDPANEIFVLRTGLCTVLKEIQVPKSAFRAELDGSLTARQCRKGTHCFTVVEELRAHSVFGDCALLVEDGGSNRRDENSVYLGSLVSKSKCEIVVVKVADLMRFSSKLQHDHMRQYAMARGDIYNCTHIREKLVNQMYWEIQKSQVVFDMCGERYRKRLNHPNSSSTESSII